MTVWPHLDAGARRARPAIMVMLLLLLAALAFSSASARHHAGSDTFVPVAGSCADHQHALQSVHEHQHEYGSGWTPRLNQRLRAGEKALTPAAIVVPPPSPGRGAAVCASVGTPTDVVLSRVGVLRI